MVEPAEAPRPVIVKQEGGEVVVKGGGKVMPVVNPQPDTVVDVDLTHPDDKAAKPPEYIPDKP